MQIYHNITVEKIMLYNIYFSPTGGTKKVADILVNKLGGEFCEVVAISSFTVLEYTSKG